MQDTRSEAQVGQEVDRLRWTQRELGARLERYRTLLELSADWFWQLDENYRFVELGVANRWPPGLPAMGSMLGRAYWEIPGFHVQGGWEAHRDLLERRQPFRSFELRHHHPDGSQSILTLSGTPIVGADGRFSGYVGVGRDVTATRQAQDALRESQRTLSTLMGNLPGMAYRCRNEPNWPMEFVSEGALALTGYRAAELQRDEPAFSSLIHPDDQAGIWDEVQQAVESGRSFQLVYRFRTPTGERWMWERGVGVRDESGALVALEGFVTDITESRRAQEEVSRLNASLEERVRERTSQLETANQEMQGFAHAIAHDLRAPLISIDGFARLLERGSAGRPAEEQRWLRRIGAGVQQMAVLTDALLTLAGLANATLQDEPVDLARIARMVLARLQAADPDRQAQLDIPERLPAQGDGRLLAQALTHLLDNAWKFSRRKPLTEITVGSELREGETVYFVADRGAGFDMAHAGRLFNGFQRLHTPAEFEGAGVGLAVAHRIIARHGGRIWAESAPQQGAVFRFTLGNPQVPPADGGTPGSAS